MKSMRLIGPRERVLALRSFAMFRAVDPADLRRIAEELGEVNYRAGAKIFSQSEKVNEVVLIVEGTVVLSRDNKTVWTGHAPDALPAAALIGQAGIAFGDVICLTDVTVLSLDRDVAVRLWETSFSLLQSGLSLTCTGIWEGLNHLPPGMKPLGEAELGTPPPRDLGFVDRLRLLAESPMFATSNLESIAEICRHQSFLSLPSGEELVAPDDVPTNFDFIVAGSIEISVDGEPVGELGVDDVFGVIEGFAKLPVAYAAKVGKPLYAVRTPISVLLEVFQDQPEMGINVLAEFERASLQLLWTGSLSDEDTHL